MRNRKGVIISPIIQMILGTVVIILFIFAFNKPLRDTVSSFLDKKELVIPEHGNFTPFQPSYTSEEQTVIDSMNGLVLAINSVATNKNVNTDNKEPAGDIKVASYKISFSSEVDIEERGINDHRDWVFDETFKLNKDNAGFVVKQQEHKIFADYIYGSCTEKNSNSWVECGSGFPKSAGKGGQCFCEDEDDTGDGYVEMEDLGIREDYIDKAMAKKLAPVRDLNPVYNIELVTYDKNGKELCRIGSWAKETEMTDTDLQDLRTWGINLDRDGDGIRGSYSVDEYGKHWPDTLPAGFNKERVSEQKIDKYFPEGKIQSINDNGEACLDSPTWVTCPGIKVYYCGKFGYKSGSAQHENEYYFHLDSEGEIHNDAGVKVLADIDTSYDEKKSSMNRNDDKIQVRDDSGDVTNFLVGAFDYAKEYDVEVISLAPVLGAAPTALAMKQMDNPRVYCYNGHRVGKSSTVVKCDPDFGGCGVCNFELPQNMSEYESAFSYIAGYGDPRYVMYYEAFPLGEEEAWVLDENTVAFDLIVATNLAVPIGGSLVKNIAKMGRFVGKVLVVPHLVARVVKGVYRPIAWSGRKSSAQIGRLGEKVSLSIKSLFYKGTKTIVGKEAAQKYLFKIFTESGNILRHAKKADIEKIASVDEVAEWVIRNDKGELDELAKLLTEENVVSSFTIMKNNLPRTVVRKGTKYTIAYAAALTMAKEDSMNQKFVPVGVDKIGAKEPFKGAVTTGSVLDELEDELSGYYVQLAKDKYKGGAVTGVLLDQPAERFFLASPCRADIAVVKSECQCWQSENESEKPEGKALEKFGNISFLKYTVNDDYPKTDARRYENAVKVCRDRSAGLGSLTFEQPVDKVDCIVVNPVVEEGSFCYSGSHTLQEMAKYSVVAGTIGANVAVDLGTGPFMLTPAAPLAKAVNFALNIGVDSAGALLTNAIADKEKWPNH